MLSCEMDSGGSGRTDRSIPDEVRMGTLWLPTPAMLGNDLFAWRGWLHFPERDWEITGDLAVNGSFSGLGDVTNLLVSGDMTIAPGGAFLMRPLVTSKPSLPGAWLTVGGALTVAEGATLYIASHPTNGAPLKVSAAAVVVAEGGLICGDGRGYAGQEHPWAAWGPGAGTQGRDPTHGTGGGYGGAGGWGFSLKPGGDSYGLPLAPLEPGSGGGGYHYGGHGGATIWITTPGELRVDGIIRSQGGHSRRLINGTYNGAGAGGGILLDAARITGAATGLIAADGAAGSTWGGGGGGGRIACWQKIPRPMAEKLIAGSVTSLGPNRKLASYQGETSVVGGTGYTNYTGDLDIKKGGDGSLEWVMLAGSVILVR